MSITVQYIGSQPDDAYLEQSSVFVQSAVHAK